MATSQVCWKDCIHFNETYRKTETCGSPPDAKNESVLCKPKLGTI